MYGSNLTRLSGIASGMDTDSLVKKLMDAERIPFNKMKQNREKLAWQSDAYRKWNSEIFSFRNKTLLDMKMSSKYGTFSTTSSKTDIISASATADAIPGTYKLKVNQLAEGASLSGKVKSGELVNEDQTITVNVNGKIGTIDIKKTDTMQDIVAKFNKAQDSEGKSLGIQAMYDSTLNQFVVRTRNTGSSQELSISSSDNSSSNLLTQLGFSTSQVSAYTGDANTKLNTKLVADGGTPVTLSLKLEKGATSETKTVTLNPGETVSDLISKLKTEGINASYDEKTQKFTLFSSDSDVTAVSLKADDTGIDTALGLDQPLAVSSEYKAVGKDAKVNFNGQDVVLGTNTAKFFGVNYTLKAVDTEGVTVTVSRDLDAEIKNIKEFVDKYNEILDKLNKAINEPVYKKFQPLTDEERKALTEKQAEQWDEKAKSGLLRRDNILSSLVNNMRLSMTSTVNNGSEYNSLAAIGIKSENYKDKGKLTIDETKLRKALEEDPEAVQNLFIQGSDITEEDIKKDPKKRNQQGLIHRLSGSFGDAFAELTKKAGVTGNAQDDQSIVGKLLQSMDKRISSMEARLIDRENRYYRQFTAMEKAMSKYNSQSSWLMQQFGGGAS
ncbi:flagellar filament capping protein FliD [Aneurinibacillus aneurinilyticus]|uniref:flagellar filament capping protein FliD n=1 Tax=Aneurinibacillus aneurinilyticus TaxID=1391 RepID=UPI0023F37864|nr:flagellar filament capping protein FliD [Aneurinibacillus aneurinilyticus]